jgi:ribosomal protein S18 acetylase RimI-like enzyme
MKIREATESDTHRIAALHAASWRDSYRGMLSDEFLDGDLVADRAEVWIERLTSPIPNQRIVLAETGKQLVGFACAFGSTDSKLGTLLDNLHVARDFQRQGIGVKLLSEIVTWCQTELPGEGLFLWVLEKNQPARHFYEQLGATKIAEEVWLAPDGRSIPCLCYAWEQLEPLVRALKKRIVFQGKHSQKTGN